VGRAETWAIRAGQAAAALVAALLLVTPWRMPWGAQLVLAVAVFVQLWLIGRLAARRAAWSHAWLQGYFAAMEDLAPDEAERP
jgi:hypothetical protein